MSSIFNFSQRPKNIIKQEGIDETRNRTSFILPEPNPKYAVSLKSFTSLELAQTTVKAPHSFEIRKVILGLLKECPDLWKNIRKINKEEWRKLGLDVYRRTGEILNVTQLVDTFRKTKNNLSQRMSKCVKDGLSVEEMEEVLLQWDFFEHIKFYYDHKLENRHFKDEDDDEIDFLGCFPPTYHDNDSTLNVDYVNEFSQELHRNQKYQHLDVETRDDYAFPSDSVSRHDDSGEPINRKRHCDISTEHDVDQISYQLHRVFTQYPEKENLIRKALFATILEFDDGNFQDLGQMFSSLATKHAVTEQKFRV